MVKGELVFGISLPGSESNIMEVAKTELYSSSLAWMLGDRKQGLRKL